MKHVTGCLGDHSQRHMTRSFLYGTLNLLTHHLCLYDKYERLPWKKSRNLRLKLWFGCGWGREKVRAAVKIKQKGIKKKKKPHLNAPTGVDTNKCVGG